MPSLTLTILGCGTSTGVPLIGCKCPVCRSKNPKNNRTRTAAWVQTRGKSLLIDTSTDLRQQALREKITRVDAVLYTHPHADHINGIDEIRSFNFLQKSSIPAYGNEWTVKELTSRFTYIFQPPKTIEGGGIPQVQIQTIPPETKTLVIAGVPVTPIPLKHGSQESLGFKIDSVAYITDCSYIPSSSLDDLKGLSVLVLDCLRLQPHGTHFHFDQAMEIATQLRAKKTYLTHMGHDFDYEKLAKKLPKTILPAYDGLKIRIK